LQSTCSVNKLFYLSEIATERWQQVM